MRRNASKHAPSTCTPSSFAAHEGRRELVSLFWVMHEGTPKGNHPFLEKTSWASRSRQWVWLLNSGRCNHHNSVPSCSCGLNAATNKKKKQKRGLTLHTNEPGVLLSYPFPFNWVWLKIKQEGLRRFRSMFPLARLPFSFWYRFSSHSQLLWAGFTHVYNHAG